MMPQPSFPFTAVVGQDGLKRALLLNLIDPTLGGVLAIGDKGTGKTTLIRSLAALMQPQGTFPFVNLPIGAGEDRVLGHISLEQLINQKQEVIRPGLLAQAHGGILYVDEINLLNDYLMDVLLDAATSGQYHLEREGSSHTFPSQFIMVGSMNPEEGNLRPQLKDRFGLSVTISTPTEVTIRNQIVQHRLAFDDDPVAFAQQFAQQEAQLVEQITAAQRRRSTLSISAELIAHCTALATRYQVEGIRADILLIKAARAFAALQADPAITTQHVDAIAPFVLQHRQNGNPPPQAPQPPSPEQQSAPQQYPPESTSAQRQTFDSILPDEALPDLPAWKQASKRGSQMPLEKIPAATPQPGGNHTRPDLRQTVGQYQATNRFELKHKKTQNHSNRHLIFLLDSSGSMAQEQVVSYAKGLIETTVLHYQTQKISYSLLTVYDGDAQTLVSHSPHPEALIQQLQQAKTGGKTNLIPALRQVKTLTSLLPEAAHELILITDGKFNAASPGQDEITAYQMYGKALQRTRVVDAERGTVKLQLAKTFAQKISATYQALT